MSEFYSLTTELIDWNVSLTYLSDLVRLVSPITSRLVICPKSFSMSSPTSLFLPQIGHRGACLVGDAQFPAIPHFVDDRGAVVEKLPALVSVFTGWPA